jgi:hypothetical protein
MTRQQLIEEVRKLSVEDRVTLIELISRSLREDLVPTGDSKLAASSGESPPPAGEARRTLSQRLRGIVKFDGPPPTDEEVKDAYADYLLEKYS